jgi:hypothetical protein
MTALGALAAHDSQVLEKLMQAWFKLAAEMQGVLERALDVHHNHHKHPTA